MERLINFSQALQLLGDIKASTLRQWCYQRKVPFQKVGARVMFRPSTLRNWLRTQERQEISQGE